LYQLIRLPARGPKLSIREEEQPSSSSSNRCMQHGPNRIRPLYPSNNCANWLRHSQQVPDLPVLNVRNSLTEVWCGLVGVPFRTPPLITLLCTVTEFH